jgi:hypothetical protein
MQQPNISNEQDISDGTNKLLRVFQLGPADRVARQIWLQREHGKGSIDDVSCEMGIENLEDRHKKWGH